MTLNLSPQTVELLHQHMATGQYATEEDLIVSGLRTLTDRDEALAGIRRGLESMQRGEGVPLDEAFEEIRRRNGLADAS